MLKMEKTKGCIGVELANRLPRGVAPQSKWDGTGRRSWKERHHVPPGSQRGHAPRTGNHLQFLSRGIPREGVAAGRGCANAARRPVLPPLSRPAARRGRERSWDLEKQIKAATDELWQEQPWQLPPLLAEK